MNESRDLSNQLHSAAFHAARTTSFLARPAASWALATGLGGVFLALIGAADSYQYSLTLRLSLWMGLCAVAWLFAIAIEAGIRSLQPPWTNPIVWWVALSVGLGAAMVPVIFLVNSSGGTAPWNDLGNFAVNSVAISGALAAIRLAAGQLFASSNSPLPGSDDSNSAAQAPAILKRLPSGLRQGRLLALASEGHYVRVITDIGSELVLVRLRDAMGETGSVEGMQVHRSWWVARDAVSDSRVVSGKLEVCIGEDLWAPVSRSFRSAWKEAGWLTR